MAENEPQPEKKGFLQNVLDKFKTASKEVADKVEDTVEDVKNSEFAGKVSETAKSVSDKAKDMVEDVKNSEFADKVGDVNGSTWCAPSWACCCWSMPALTSSKCSRIDEQ